MRQEQVTQEKSKIEAVTSGLEPPFRTRLESMPATNSSTICDDILYEITTGNIRDSAKGLKIYIPYQLSRFHLHKPFREIVRFVLSRQVLH